MTLDELRERFAADGFKSLKNPIQDRLNECDWYLYRQAKTRVVCECNDRPPMIVITPYRYSHHETHESATVEICGERGDLWQKFQIYGLSVDDMTTRFEEIERRIVAAWEAAH